MRLSMQTHPIPEEKQSKSDLGSIILNILKEINIIKQKYPLPTTASDEHKNAVAIINSIEICLLTTNEIYKFLSQKKELSLSDMGSLLNMGGKLDAEITKLRYHQTDFFIFIEKQIQNIIQEILDRDISPDNNESFLAAIVQALREKKAIFLEQTKKNLDITATADESFEKMIKTIETIPWDFSEIHHEDIAEYFKVELHKALFSAWHRMCNFSICHPMTFDFYKAITPIIKNAPTDLEILLPSFNPQILSIDTRNSFLMRMIGKLFDGALFTFTPIKMEASDKPSYQYKFTLYSKEKEKLSVSFDFSKTYLQILTQLPDRFAEEKNIKLQNLNTPYSEFFNTHVSPHKNKCISFLAPLSSEKNISETQLRRYNLRRMNINITHRKHLLEENQKLQSILAAIDKILDPLNLKSIMDVSEKFPNLINRTNWPCDLFESDLYSCFAEEIQIEIKSIKNRIADELEHLSKCESAFMTLEFEHTLMNAYPESAKQFFCDFIENYDAFNSIQPSPYPDDSEWADDISQFKYDREQYIKQLQQKISMGTHLLSTEMKLPQDTLPTYFTYVSSITIKLYQLIHSPNNEPEDSDLESFFETYIQDFILTELKSFKKTYEIIQEIVKNLSQKEIAEEKSENTKKEISMAKQMACHGTFPAAIPSLASNTTEESSVIMHVNSPSNTKETEKLFRKP